MTLRETIHKAIKKHAGLSDWDDWGIFDEVDAILRALGREGFVIERKDLTSNLLNKENENDKREN